MMSGLELSIVIDIRRHGFPSNKKATNWPGCLRHGKLGEKPDAVVWAGNGGDLKTKSEL
jgi:hypothetical protein